MEIGSVHPLKPFPTESLPSIPPTIQEFFHFPLSWFLGFLIMSIPSPPLFLKERAGVDGFELCQCKFQFNTISRLVQQQLYIQQLLNYQKFVSSVCKVNKSRDTKSYSVLSINYRSIIDQLSRAISSESFKFIPCVFY